MSLINDEHPLNTFSPIVLTDDGIEILVNDEHFSNDCDPIDLTDDGIEIFVKNVHFLNACFSIISILFGSVISTKGNCLNCLSIILVGEFGISIGFLKSKL